MRRLGPSLAAVALVLALAGCGGSGPLDSSDRFGSAVDNTIEAGSSKMRSTGRTVFAPDTKSKQTFAFNAEGVFDNLIQRGEMSTTQMLVGDPQRRQTTYEQIYDGATGWVSPLGFGRWFKFERAQAVQQIPQFVYGLGPTPAEVFTHLRRASTATTEVGTAVVGGIDTTHYRADADLSKVVEAADLAPLDPSYGPLEIWVDDDGLIRRAKYDFTRTVGETQGFPIRARTTQTVDFFDFGTDVDVTLPAPDTVIDPSDVNSGLGLE